jgi:hypothetical protein
MSGVGGEIPRSGTAAAVSASVKSLAATVIAPGICTVESIMITEPPTLITSDSQ